ncbi:Fructokinase-2 [Hibiscus syriacus]|uniref:Fructokinase-2 n=1 Tax=Hibiscus syriacus TaxID=106335 RepID=A0A6A3CLG9_HIBSY|nr:Fructokinase-2 [Hibiscus syriacus]
MAPNGVVSDNTSIVSFANVAIAVSRLGGKASFVGKLGDDEFGHMLADILKQNGVSGDGILFDEGARTALAFVTLRADGEREFMFYRNPSADMLLKPEELNLDLIRSMSPKSSTSINPTLSRQSVPLRINKFDRGAMQISSLKAMEVAKESELPWGSGCFPCEYGGYNWGWGLLVGACCARLLHDPQPYLREVLIFANACGAITTKKGAIPALPLEAEALALIMIVVRCILISLMDLNIVLDNLSSYYAEWNGDLPELGFNWLSSRPFSIMKSLGVAFGDLHFQGAPSLFASSPFRLQASQKRLCPWLIAPSHAQFIGH